MVSWRQPGRGLGVEPELEQRPFRVPREMDEGQGEEVWDGPLLTVS